MSPMSVCVWCVFDGYIHSTSADIVANIRKEQFIFKGQGISPKQISVQKEYKDEKMI